MRWPSFYCFVQLLLLALVVAMPSSDKDISSSNALALRSTSELDIYNDVHDSSLQPRAGPSLIMGVVMMSFISLSTGTLSAWFLARGPADKHWIGYAALVASTLSMLAIAIQGTRATMWDFKMQEARQIHEQEMMKLEKEEKQLTIEEKKDKSHMDYTKWQADMEKHALDMQETQRKVKIADDTIQETKDKKDRASFEGRMKPRITALNDNVKNIEHLQDMNKQLQSAWESLQANDLSDEERKTKQEDTHNLIKKIEAARNQDSEDMARLKKHLGNEEMNKLQFESVVTDKKDKRGMRRHSSPRLIEEVTTSCETRLCHRKWYSRSYPDIGKREASPHEAIHDFHLTPPDFDFDDEPSSLNRRGDDAEEEDCYAEEDGMFGRMVSQYGGDASSAMALGLLDADDFQTLLNHDIKKFGYVDYQGHKISKVITPGELNCAKIDLSNGTDHGNLGPPAMNLAFTVDSDSKYKDMKAEDMVSQCVKKMSG